MVIIIYEFMFIIIYVTFLLHFFISNFIYFNFTLARQHNFRHIRTTATLPFLQKRIHFPYGLRN